MDSKPKPTIERLTWQQAHNLLEGLVPDLVEIIDNISPGDSYPIYRAYYPFGSKIVHDGLFMIPVNGQLYPLHHPIVPKEFKEQLNYNYGANPIGISLESSMELYIEINNRVIPYSLITPGKIFGLWRIFDGPVSHCPTIFRWQISAGARSLYMLPKISENLRHKKLIKALHIHDDKPKSLYDHWNIFKSIINSDFPSVNWGVNLIFFGNKWIDKLTDPKWIFLRDYMLTSVWHGSEFWRNQYIWDATFANIKNKRNIKEPAHIIDHVKHILSVAAGALPGFAPAMDNSLAPIHALQKIYRDIYDLKTHPPIIMQPEMFNAFNKSLPVYLSFQLSTAIDLSPKANEKNTAISDLFSTQLLLKKYIHELKQEQGLEAEPQVPLGCIADLVSIDFFHDERQQYKSIKAASEIPIHDQRFNITTSSTKYDITFPTSSTFVRGCIKIASKKD